MSILLHGLSKRLGDQLVVNRVGLQIEDGELFVLLGSSGSGKSTILRLIAGLLQPDDGRIELKGRDVTWLPPQKRGVGFVFQNYSIFRHMTAAENVEFGLRIRNVPASDRRRRSAELLELVGLTGFGERYADQLSGGQQQRVALARALAYEPSVLLLDEPFGALDAKIRAQLRKSLKKIQRQLKVTTILVTHDQEEAFELADRIGVIAGGSLIETGTPEMLYQRPRTEYAATFIGGGNLLVGRVIAGQILLGAVTLPLPPEAPAHDEAGSVRILFRPETVLLQPEPFAPDAGIHVLGQGQVVERAFAGALQRLVLEVPDLKGARPLRPRLAYGQHTARIEALQPAAAGCPRAWDQRLWIAVRKFHVLDPARLALLICTDGSPGGNVAAQFGCQLAQTLGATPTCLAVAESDAHLAGMRANLDSLRRSWLAELPELETVVRQGSSAAEILAEAQDGHYDLLILGRRPAAESDRPGLGSIAAQVLAQPATPLLLAGSSTPRIGHMLICTAGGEPGKADVRFGGRLAWRIGSRVTVLHVNRPHATPDEIRRTERHLRQAQASLETLGVQCGVETDSGPALERILRAAERVRCDLIVIGASLSGASRHGTGPDLATQLASRVERPILIVPMVE